MSIFIKNNYFVISFKYNNIVKDQNTIGCKIDDNGSFSLSAKAKGRDFETMSKIIEDSSIINSVNGKPMLRTSVLCKNIILKFIIDIEINSEDFSSNIVPTAENIKDMDFNIVKHISKKWLELTSGD
jgi:hypothetical protein